MTEVFSAFAGVIVGAGITLLVMHLRRKPAEEIARSLVVEAEKLRLADLDRVIGQLKDTFGNLSREALSANSAEFLKLAGTRLTQEAQKGESALESKKKLIDAGLETLNKKVGELNVTLHASEKSRRETFGTLIERIEATTKAATALKETTTQLTQALAHPAHRGQWGERMAEDVLRLAGMIEGVNYRKQFTTESGSKPDFVFLLPSGPCVNMDVKFPLANYLRFLQSDEEQTAKHKQAFLADVRARVKEVTTREYINPAGGTVDFVLVFIPNEQLYGFIHENDPQLLEYALERKVVLCSPLTLFAILAVIRQAADNFRLQQASNEILSLLGEFNKQWSKYGDVVKQLGDRLELAMKAYADLTSTRKNQLERQLDKIEAIRQRQDQAPGLPQEQP